MTEKPENCTNDHLVFLDKLREEGSVNMYGSGINVAAEYNISIPQANKIVAYWMSTFSERHPSK